MDCPKQFTSNEIHLTDFRSTLFVDLTVSMCEREPKREGEWESTQENKKFSLVEKMMSYLVNTLVK